MKKFVLGTRVALGLASERTLDKDHERRTASLKLLYEGLNDYIRSIVKVKSAVEELLYSLNDVSKAFEKMSGVYNTSCEPKEFVTCFLNSVQELQNEGIDPFIKKMNADALKHSGNIKMGYEECICLELQRSRAVNEYDVYRSSVSKKEMEYAKKGKSLSDSKSYIDDVKQRDALKTMYEMTDEAFKQKHNALMSILDENSKLCAKGFTECTSALFSKLKEHMDLLHTKVSTLR